MAVRTPHGTRSRVRSFHRVTMIAWLSGKCASCKTATVRSTPSRNLHVRMLGRPFWVPETASQRESFVSCWRQPA